nr:endophilin-A3 isoform X2 [Macaca nemestrina]
MSVAGLKKQFHKASQLFSEKISGAEGTKLDDEFLDMERKIDVTNKAVAEILSKTTEYLQPNPAYRAKLGMLNTVSKIRGQVKATGYPQTEGLLGDCMLKYGKELGEDSTFGPMGTRWPISYSEGTSVKGAGETARQALTSKDTPAVHLALVTARQFGSFPCAQQPKETWGNALIEVGESMKLMAEVKDSLDINVKQTFIDPLQLLQDKDLKEIGHHLKKLEGRRLDYDYKKKRVGKIPDEEVRQAVEKFEESKELAERSMFNFLENDLLKRMTCRLLKMYTSLFMLAKHTCRPQVSGQASAAHITVLSLSSPWAAGCATLCLLTRLLTKSPGRTSQPVGRVHRGSIRLSQTVHRDSAGAAEQATDANISCIQCPQTRIQAKACEKEC